MITLFSFLLIIILSLLGWVVNQDAQKRAGACEGAA